MGKESVYGFEMITVEEMEQMAKKKKAWLIDLRSEENFREGHIKNARNYPIAYIEEWKDRIPKGVHLILYCEHGNQSLLAARKLRGRRGTVYTLTGGYQAYREKTGSQTENGKGIDTAVFNR